MPKDAGSSHRPRQLTWGRRVLFAIATPIIVGFLKLAWSTYRFRLDEDERFAALAKRDEPVVLAFWHEGIMTVGWYVARLLKRGVRVTILISPSADGELGTMILASFGSRAVRGSARRSGAAALRGLNRAIHNDRQSPAIAVDGSKGPRRRQPRLAGANLGPPPGSVPRIQGRHHGRQAIHSRKRDGRR
jgi:lysophospholipid acyltransferase (LPLAT)-like uncharacterized protein